MFTDYFDQAFCINLDKREDRWKESKKQFNKIGLDVERVSGVDGFLEPKTSIRPGEIGCLRSHLKVFNIAKERKLKSFLLLEDDVEFDEDFNEKFIALENQIKNFDILYMGNNPHTGTRKKISENINRVLYAYSAHCVIFKDTCYEDVIKTLTGPILYPVDVLYGNLQSTLTSYSITPPLAWQRKGFSDINQEIVDYQFLRGYN